MNNFLVVFSKLFKCNGGVGNIDLVKYYESDVTKYTVTQEIIFISSQTFLLSLYKYDIY